MTTPRIDNADILSFKLKLPRTELEALPQAAAAAGIRLAIAAEDSDLVLSVVEGDSSLRFRNIGTDVVLTEIQIQNDTRGVFFQRVLGPLMVRFAGDLHCRLVWNTAERNSHGNHAEVKIARGSTTYPGLTSSPFASPAMGTEGVAGAAPENEAEDAPPTPEELEVKSLLDKAQKHWAEYQKLKTKKS